MKPIGSRSSAPRPAELPVTDEYIRVIPRASSPGLGRELLALGRYLTQTEVHTYAFSVAANSILSLFPFIVLMLTISWRVFHSRTMELVVGDLMRNFLPTGQDFVVRNMTLLAMHPQKGSQLLSIGMLLVTSTGVFLPLEVALNQVWGVAKNRSYLHNQVVSLGLAFAVGLLAMMSVAFSAGQKMLMSLLFFGHTDTIVFSVVTGGFLKVLGVFTSVLLFFLVYWVLPNRKIPARAVLPSAIVTGLLWEAAKWGYVAALPWLDFRAVYGPFYISVGLMMWAFLSGLLLLGGAHFSSSRYNRRTLTREKGLTQIGTDRTEEKE